MSTPIADLVANLLSTGIPPDAVVAAVRAAELHAQSVGSADSAAARRRAWDRERKRKNPSGISTGKQVGDEERTLLLTNSPPEKTIQVKKDRTSEEIVEGQKKRSRGTPLPDDWQPSSHHFDQAVALHLSQPQVLGMAEDMRLWAKGNSNRQIARKADWEATFSGWMRRESKKANGNGQHRQGGDGHRNQGLGFSAYARRSAAKAAGYG